MLPIQHQDIILIDAGILQNAPNEDNTTIFIEEKQFEISAMWRPFSLGLEMLTHTDCTIQHVRQLCIVNSQ